VFSRILVFASSLLSLVLSLSLFLSIRMLVINTVTGPVIILLPINTFPPLRASPESEGKFSPWNFRLTGTFCSTLSSKMYKVNRVPCNALKVGENIMQG